MEKMADLISLKTPRLGRVMQFIKKNFLIITILIIAAFLRLYRIGDYMTFLGDEGRDVLIVKHILEGDLTFLGPRASAGDFFLGPFYYYLMTPFLWLWQLDPVGPAVMVALFGIATVYLVYWIGSKFFGKEAGLVAAVLYAIAPIVIAYSRSSWNPNVVPFFTLVTMLLLYSAVKNNCLKYFLFVGILLGLIMQLHYLGTFVAVIIALFTLIGSFIQIGKKWKDYFRAIVMRYVTIFLGFIIGFSPFLLFEIRHGFPNLRTIFKFIFSNQAASDQTDASSLAIIQDVFVRVFARIVLNFPDKGGAAQIDQAIISLWQIGAVVLGLVAIGLVFKHKDNLQKSLLITWLLAGIVLFGLYKKPIYEYYFGFMFPVPFILVGNVFSQLFKEQKKKKLLWGRVAAGLLLIILIGLNLLGIPFRHEPNRQKKQMQTIAEFVLSKTDNKPFNFALITPGNSDHAYRYFFERADRNPVTIENEVIDPARKTVTDQLLIVCEYPECNVLGHPLWEVAGFGPAQQVGEWNVSVVKVYKLIPAEQ